MSRKIEIGDKVEIAVTNDSLDIIAGDIGYVIDIDWNEAYPYQVDIDDVGEVWVSDNEIVLMGIPVILEPIIAANPVAAALAEQVGGTFRSPVQIPPVLEVEDTFEVYCPEILAHCPYCETGIVIRVEIK
jgi:hypothetical protein